MSDFKRCPDCGRIIPANSDNCRYCHGMGDNIVSETNGNSITDQTKSTTSSISLRGATSFASGLAAKAKAKAVITAQKVEDGTHKVTIDAQNAISKAQKNMADAKATKIGKPASGKRQESEIDLATKNVNDSLTQIIESDDISNVIDENSEKDQTIPQTNEALPTGNETELENRHYDNEVYDEYEKPKSHKGLIIIISSIVLAIGIIVGAYFLFFANGTGGSNESIADSLSDTIKTELPEEPEVQAGIVYTGNIGRYPITLLINEENNGKYFYDNNGSAVKNYIELICTNANGNELWLTEFTKQGEPYGNFYLMKSGDSLIGIYYRPDGVQFDVNLKLSDEKMSDIDSNFAEFIEIQIPKLQRIWIDRNRSSDLDEGDGDYYEESGDGDYYYD